jgi:hypothetical protein
MGEQSRATGKVDINASAEALSNKTNLEFATGRGAGRPGAGGPPSCSRRGGHATQRAHRPPAAKSPSPTLAAGCSAATSSGTGSPRRRRRRSGRSRRSTRSAPPSGRALRHPVHELAAARHPRRPDVGGVGGHCPQDRPDVPDQRRREHAVGPLGRRHAETRKTIVAGLKDQIAHAAGLTRTKAGRELIDKWKSQPEAYATFGREFT